jgi:hypothetical protein
MLLLRSERNWFNGPERIFQSRLCGLRLRPHPSPARRHTGPRNRCLRFVSALLPPHATLASQAAPTALPAVTPGSPCVHYLRDSGD